jgi:hypothetical protein
MREGKRWRRRVTRECLQCKFILFSCVGTAGVAALVALGTKVVGNVDVDLVRAGLASVAAGFMLGVFSLLPHAAALPRRVAQIGTTDAAHPAIRQAATAVSSRLEALHTAQPWQPSPFGRIRSCAARRAATIARTVASDAPGRAPMLAAA